MLLTRNQLRRYLSQIIKESIQDSPNVGVTNIDGEDYIVYNNLTHFQEFVDQILAGQEDSATGFGQYFERVMLGFLDEYKALNSGDFNYPFADIYKEDGAGDLVLYSVKMKRKLDPTAIGGGAIKPDQIRSSLNNHVAQANFLNKEIRYGLVGGEIDPIAFPLVNHVGLPIKITQLSPLLDSPTFVLKKATSLENIKLPDDFIKDYQPNPYYPLNEAKIKNSPEDFYYIEVSNVEYKYASAMLGSGIFNPNIKNHIGGKYTKLTEDENQPGTFTISADDSIFTITGEDDFVVNDPLMKRLDRMKTGDAADEQYIEEILRPKILSSIKSRISGEIKPSSKRVNTKPDFVDIFMGGKKKEIPLLNVILTGGFVDAQEAINYINNESKPPSNLTSLIQKIDQIMVGALPGLDKAKSFARLLGMMLIKTLNSQRDMIEKTKAIDPTNFPNGFFCRMSSGNQIVFNFSEDVDFLHFDKTKKDYGETFKGEYTTLKSAYGKYKSELRKYNKRKEKAEKKNLPFLEEPPVAPLNPGTFSDFVKTKPKFPDAMPKPQVALACQVLVKVLIQELLSGIAGIDFLFNDSPETIAQFKVACREFYLFKKISDDSLTGKVLSVQEMMAHKQRIDSFRDRIVMPLARQVLPQEVSIIATKESLTFNDLLGKLNLNEVLQLTTAQITPHQVIETLASLADLMDLIIQIATVDMSSAFSLLAGQQQAAAAESKIYEKILTELLKYSRR